MSQISLKDTVAENAAEKDAVVINDAIARQIAEQGGQLVLQLGCTHAATSSLKRSITLTGYAFTVP